MDHAEEARAVGEVIDRLVGRFPDLPRDRIAAVVEAAHVELEGNPIRDFVPVLVERTAKQRLKQEAMAAPVLADAALGDAILADIVPGDAADDAVELDPMEIERLARERRSGFLFGDLGGGPS
ncbi:three-helix bundle dimerization domain-containing protein [Agromyces sp. NPDC055520]